MNKVAGLGLALTAVGLVVNVLTDNVKEKERDIKVENLITKKVDVAVDAKIKQVHERIDGLDRIYVKL